MYWPTERRDSEGRPQFVFTYYCWRIWDSIQQNVQIVCQELGRGLFTHNSKNFFTPNFTVSLNGFCHCPLVILYPDRLCSRGWLIWPRKTEKVSINVTYDRDSSRDPVESFFRFGTTTNPQFPIPDRTSLRRLFVNTPDDNRSEHDLYWLRLFVMGAGPETLRVVVGLFVSYRR